MSDLQKVKVALDILTGKKDIALEDYEILEYNTHSMKKIPSLQELKLRCEEVICKIVGAQKS